MVHFCITLNLQALFGKGIWSLGLNAADYSGNSLPIGAAMEAARLGLGEDLIKWIGRWELVQFQSYVRLDRL